MAIRLCDGDSWFKLVPTASHHAAVNNFYKYLETLDVKTGRIVNAVRIKILQVYAIFRQS